VDGRRFLIRGTRHDLAGRFVEEAVERAEGDARQYAGDVDAEYVGLAQAYHLAEDRLGNGAEVFSLARVSDLATNDYLSTFFDTGTERQRHITE
jgi:hypothetical protein